MKNLFFLTLPMFLFLGCTNNDFFENDINLDKVHQPQLAVTAQFTSLDSVHTLFLSKTISATDVPLYDTLKDAIIELLVNQEPKQFVYNPSTGYYELPTNFEFLPQTSFQLVIDDPIFGIATATQTLLTSPQSIKVDTISQIKQSDGTFNLYDNILSIRFLDPEDVQNYYILEVLGAGIGFNSQTREDGNLKENLLVFSESSLIEYTGDKRLFFTDQFFDGKQIDFSFNYHAPLGWDSLHQIEVRLYSTTREGYFYQQSTDKYNLTRFQNFTEPVTSFSNIENGVGVFSTARLLTKKID